MSEEKILTLKFDEIHCSDCARKIEQHLLNFPGIRDVNILLKNKKAHVTLDVQPARSGDILFMLRELGFPAEVVMLEDTVGISEHGMQESFFRLFRKRLLRIQLLTGIVLTVVLFVLYILKYFFDWNWIDSVSIILTLPILFWVSFPLFHDFMHGPNKFDLLIYLTGFSLFVLSVANHFFLDQATYYFLVGLIFTMTLASKYIEQRATNQVLGFEKTLLQMLPRRAKIVEADGQKRYVPLTHIQVGNVIEVRSQDRIPCDGVVVRGNSTVDESFLAGESLPQERGIGSFVLAGSLNQSGTIALEVTKVGDDVVLAQMIRALRSARKTVSHIQKLLDRIAWVLLPVLVLIAAGTFLGWYFGGIDFLDSVRTAAAVLLVASPYTFSRVCALAYPLALQKAATRGVFFKNVHNLEQMPRVQKIIFELYPTLVQKNIEITDIIGGDRFKIIQMIGSLETHSDTPIGRALVHKAEKEGVTLSRHIKDVYEYPGRGIEGTVDGRPLLVGSPEFVKEQKISLQNFETQLADFANEEKIPLVLATKKEALGVVALRYTVSSSTLRTLRKLTDEGMRTFLISGHFEPSLHAIAKHIGIQTVLHEIHDQVRTSLVVGLAKTRGLLLSLSAEARSAVFQSAHIGVIMKERENLSFDGPDVLLSRFGLVRLPAALYIARHARRIVSQNILWAFVYNVIAVSLAFTNLISPELAVVLSALSPLVILANSLRLKNDPSTRKKQTSHPD